MIELMPRLMALLVRLKNAFAIVISPITMAIDGMAHILAPLFEMSMAIRILMLPLQALAFTLEVIGEGVTFLMSVLNGFMSMFMGFLFDIVNLKNPFRELASNFKEGFLDYFHKGNMADPAKNTSNVVTNIGKVEIRNEFKEQLEPDRIAFSLKEQLMKAANNPTQARGNSFQGAFAGGTQFSGGR